ncbi:hypothetical protein LCGC14_3050450, partial [marine sediment metagenome]
TQELVSCSFSFGLSNALPTAWLDGAALQYLRIIPVGHSSESLSKCIYST